MPNPRQALFLALMGLEAFYGGAAGGGKSSALLMAALQFVHVPGYAALLLRKTFSDLNQPGALIPRSHEWLAGSDARWVASEHAWYFPSGAILKFGYLDGPLDCYQYQSSEFQYIAFDELSHFREFDYRYLFSRLRKTAKVDVPLRMRAGSNPGGVGHEWVKRRFIDEGRTAGRVFIPARIVDNPHLNREEYVKSLAHLDPITRRQLEEGDWTARTGGLIFRREWFRVVDQCPDGLRWVRAWDLAATGADEADDPDWTSGALCAMHEGQLYIRDMRHARLSPMHVEALIKHCSKTDPPGTAIRIEQEPGASGKSMIDHYARHVLPGMDFRGVPSLRDKVLRAGPLSSAAEAGNVFIVRGQWVTTFLDELDAFPNGSHDDQVDAATLALSELTQAEFWSVLA